MLGWLKKKKTPVLSAKEGYDLWALSYAQESNPIKELSNKFVASILPDLQGKAVVDVGCGTGHFCMYAQQQQAAAVIGIDLSPVMIDQAKKNCPAGRFYCGDISELNLPEEPVDVIICALVIGHLQNISTLFAKLSSMLKSGGDLILTDFHPILTQQKARRTFKNVETQQIIEIKHYLHPLNEIKKLLESSGFRIEYVNEPKWNNTPVVYGIKAIKPRHGSAA